MSITGGLFNTGKQEDKAGDTKTTSDGEVTGAEEVVDLTTSLPGFDDPGLDDDAILIDTDAVEESPTVSRDEAGDFGGSDDEPLDPES